MASEGVYGISSTPPLAGRLNASHPLRTGLSGGAFLGNELLCRFYRHRGITLAEMRSELESPEPFAGNASDGKPFGDGL